MKFFVNTSEMKEAVAAVSKALPSSSSVSLLEGIYIKASGNELYLKCFDLSLLIETSIPAVVEEDGTAIIPGRLTTDLILRMDGETIDFSSEKMTMFIKCGRIKGNLQFLDPTDYPKMESDNNELRLSIKPSLLKSMIKQTAFAASTEAVKPILTGVLCEFLGDGWLSMVALDGYRLAKRTEHIGAEDGISRRIVVPAAALKEISNILPDAEDAIQMILMKKQIKFIVGGTIITSRLLDGEFISYSNILPKIFCTHVVISRAEMLSAVETAMLMARESKNSLIKMTFGRDMLTINANSENGKVNEEVDLNLTGSELEIAFNGRYFMDALRVIEDDCVALSLNNSVTPCVIEPTSGESFYYLVLPVRILTGVD